MSVPVKGWCPGALRPMMSGDGLIVRVRPRQGRLARDQVIGLCDAAERHGNGVLEFTRRANVQVRGVDAHDALLEVLDELGLLDPDPDSEGRRNILVSPLWRDGGLTSRLAEELALRLDTVPDLPAKFGYAVDTEDTRMLTDTSADVRIERGQEGLIVRADGCDTGRSVSEGQATSAALELASWFAENRGDARRMAQVQVPDVWQGSPAERTGSLPIGDSPLGPVVGIAFGQIRARDLEGIIRASDAKAVRVTPWRRIVLEGGLPVEHSDLVTDECDPLLRADACPGAPSCAAATVVTRDLARQLATRTPGSVHVSGCSKGCARTGPASVTLVGRDGLFDLVRNGGTGDEPLRRGMTSAQAMELDLQ